MPRYAREIAPAVLAMSALRERMLADLDLKQGGIGWWSEHLGDPRRMLVGDYLIGLTDSTETNLVEAVMHLHQAKEGWYAAGTETTASTLAGRPRYPLSDRGRDREVENQAHAAGFFRAVGSVLDNLAGIVIGAAGLAKDIVLADLKHLLSGNSVGLIGEEGAGRTAQMALVSVLRDQIDAAPDGWFAWVDGTRNTLVHRARRVVWEVDDRSRGDGVFRPLARDPDQTAAEAMARTPRDGAGREYLDEHALDTMAGTLQVVLSSTRAVAIEAGKLWDARRANPSLIVQPVAQWPRIARGKVTGFAGFDPGAGSRITVAALMLNPRLWRRMQAARLDDGRHGQWANWLE